MFDTVFQCQILKIEKKKGIPFNFVRDRKILGRMRGPFIGRSCSLPRGLESMRPDRVSHTHGARRAARLPRHPTTLQVPPHRPPSHVVNPLPILCASRPHHCTSTSSPEIVTELN